MTEPRKTHKRLLAPPAQPRRQFSIPFESTGLLGLTSAERMKVVTQLSQLLLLTAGLAPKEITDER